MQLRRLRFKFLQWQILLGNGERLPDIGTTLRSMPKAPEAAKFRQLPKRHIEVAEPAYFTFI